MPGNPLFIDVIVIFSRVRWPVDHGVFCKHLGQSPLVSVIFRTNMSGYNMCISFFVVFLLYSSAVLTFFARVQGLSSSVTRYKSTALKVNRATEDILLYIFNPN